MGAEPHEPADDVGDVEIGGRADHDEVGPVDGGEADELPAGPGLGDDVDVAASSTAVIPPARTSAELVRDDRAFAPVSTQIVRHTAPPSGRDLHTLQPAA